MSLRTENARNEAGLNIDAEPAENEERLVELLDKYAGALQAGDDPSVEAFADRHVPEDDAFRRELIDCLEGVRVIHTAVESAREEAPVAPTVSDSSITLDGVVETPRVLGDYRVGREIGRGGMGVVYEAEEQSLRRKVALKVLPFAAVLDQRQITRFRNEAQAAAGLHHPHIVPVFAIGQERGVHYYAMQYIEGQSLAQAITELRGPDEIGRRRTSPDATTRTALELSPTTDTPRSQPAQPVGKERATTAATFGETNRGESFFRSAARLAADAADALQHAHDLGVVHRDVKPSNLMIDGRGKVWVADFGLARVQTDLGVTVTGDVVGTLRYMSPEQARGRADQVDGRTDVYALGATLYELLTLKQALPGENRQQLLEHLERIDPITPRRHNPATPPDLENIVRRAMEKDPAARYASAGELRDDLLRYLDGRPTIARPPNTAERVGKWMRRRRRTVAVAAAMLAVVSVVSIASAVLVDRARDRAEAALAESELHRGRAERLLDQARGVLDRFGSDLSDQLAATPGAEAVRSRALEDTLAYYRTFLKESDSDPRLAVSAARTRVRAAAVAERLGKPTEAASLYDEATVSLESLIDESPDDAEVASWLARGLNNRSLLARQQGDEASARRGLDRVVELRRHLLAAEPKDAGRLSDLAAALSDRASLDSARPNDGKRRLEEAVALLQRARRIDPEDSGHTRRLGIAHNSLASLLRAVEPNRANEASELAVEQLASLVASEPNVASYQADLAMAYSNRGALAGDSRRWSDAADAYAAAAAELDRLVERSPLVPRHRSELAVALASQSTALARADRPDDSDSAFDLADRALRSLVADYPRADRYVRSLAALWNNRGVALRDSGRLDDAARAFGESVELEEQRLARSTESGPTLLALHYANHAQVLGRLGRFSEAAEIETKRLALIERTGSSQ
ncbi:MAG: serine/threonine-protein kinase [Planctomycetota bacterium]